MCSKKTTVVWSSAEETTRWAVALGTMVEPRDVILLDGPLGAGKTHFVKGLAQGLGISPEQVTSPSFSLIQEYAGRISLYHIDVYRLATEAELSELLLPDLMEQEAVFAIEWMSQFPSAFPSTFLHLEFQKQSDPNVRIVQISAHGERAVRRWEDWQQRTR